MEDEERARRQRAWDEWWERERERAMVGVAEKARL